MMSIFNLPREIFYYIIEDLSFTDLAQLDQANKNFYIFFRSHYYLEKIKLNFVPLVPYYWSPIGIMAAHKCRKEITIPESNYFFGNTEMLIRSLQKKQSSVFDHTWNKIREKGHQQLVDRSISYPLIIEAALSNNAPLELIEDIKYYYHASEEKKKYLHERFSGYYLNTFNGGKYISLITEAVQNNEMINMKQVCFNTILSRCDDELIKYFTDQSNIPVLVIGACLMGRKDILFFIQSLIGMIPYSYYLDNLLVNLELDEIKEWMMRRLKIVYM